MKQLYDLTTPISEEMTTFPGDPSFKVEKVHSLDKGESYNLHSLHMGNHLGTHIDFPSHVKKDGKTSSDYSLNDLVGAGLIIEVPEQETSISDKFLEKQPIFKNDIVFFKTKNSKSLSKRCEFSKDFVYVEPDAAKVLISKGVKIVGIDYLSVDKYDAEDLPVHHSLLSNNILIVEGLKLSEVPIGRCKIYIIPLHVLNLDGLPTRVFMEKTEDQEEKLEKGIKTSKNSM